MADVEIRAITPDDTPRVRQFLIEHWAGDIMVVHGQVFRPHEHPGFIAESGEHWLGLITYRIAGGSCEILSLDSLDSGRGIGTALVQAALAAAQAAGCSRIFLITTNDNLSALRFYQKRGFVLAALYRDAVSRSRTVKPSIPLIGDYGIPIRDELELELSLGQQAG